MCSMWEVTGLVIRKRVDVRHKYCSFSLNLASTALTRCLSYLVLPSYTADEIPSTCPAKEVTKIALRLKYQIEQVIPCEIQEGAITDPNSRVITKEVIRTAKDAGGDGDCRACVIYCLLVCLRWFKMQAVVELWDSEVHGSRALACEVIAKRMYVITYALSHVDIEVTSR